jgi:hypothetical protein
MVMLKTRSGTNLRKIYFWVRRLASRYPDNPSVTALRNAPIAAAAVPPPVGKTRFAVQCLENPFYFGLFTAISQHLRSSIGAAGELVVVRSISGAMGVAWRQRLARSSLIGSILASQWIRAFRGTVDQVAYRSVSLFHPISDLLDWFRSRAVWRRARLTNEFAMLNVLGVVVGDLIIDSYLRFRPSPRFDINDPFVRRLIWQAHRDVRRARSYFRIRKPSLYLTAFSTYIEHGIAVRAALQEGVRVKSFGSFVQFGKELTLADWFHTPDTSGYRSTFETLDKQDERLTQAELMLRQRLSGGIDIATSYMNVSAYAATADSVPDVSGAVVVFLHDFYDSPHVYADLVFHDFWDWTCFTIDTLTQANRKFILKPHPNQIALNSDVLNDLLGRYPALSFLSPRITSVQLADAGMLCGVTMYGTVAHELAYLGIPTIACAKHPHHRFEFCRTARTVEQYRKYLQTADQMPIAKSGMRRQALEFYYMHNLYGDADLQSLRSDFVAFWKVCHSADASSDMLIDRFCKLTTSTALAAFARRALNPG